MRLEPRVVFVSGITATGKSTVMKEVAKRIDNTVYLDRDDINQGNLHVSTIDAPRLSRFEDYVANTGIFPNHARIVSTPFGRMIQIDPYNDFYRRHIRDQSYLIQSYLTRTCLRTGKVPILDCIVTRQIQDGTLRKLMDHQFFKGYPRYHVHFTADEEIVYRRALKRSEGDEAAKKRIDLIRVESPTSSKESFHRFATEEQPMIPKELEDYHHLLIDTSRKSVAECTQQCIDYISSL